MPEQDQKEKTEVEEEKQENNNANEALKNNNEKKEHQDENILDVLYDVGKLLYPYFYDHYIILSNYIEKNQNNIIIFIIFFISIVLNITFFVEGISLSIAHHLYLKNVDDSVSQLMTSTSLESHLNELKVLIYENSDSIFYYHRDLRLLLIILVGISIFIGIVITFLLILFLPKYHECFLVLNQRNIQLQNQVSGLSAYMQQQLTLFRPLLEEKKQPTIFTPKETPKEEDEDEIVN